MRLNIKTCSKCGEIKKLNNFNKRVTSKDGLDSWCSECCKVWRDNNVVGVSIIYAVCRKDTNKVVYIGETLKTLQRRIYSHKSDSFNVNSTNYTTKIQQAIRDEGWDAFKFVVITDKYSEHFTEDYFMQMLQPELNTLSGNKQRSIREEAQCEA